MFGVPGPLGAKLGDFELGGGGPMYVIVYPDISFQEALYAVKTFRNRPRLQADFRKFQVEFRKKSLVLIKARNEPLGSKFYQTRRLLTLKHCLRTYVHKKRFKSTFAKTAADKRIRQSLAATFKSKAFWKVTKLTAKALCPVIRSLRAKN